jgi:protein gp37
MERRYKGEKYAGEPRLLKKELEVDYGEGKVIFIEHCNDLFASDIPSHWVDAVLTHCRKFPCNEYVFQTKNPVGYRYWLNDLPENRILGCTIEAIPLDVAVPTWETEAPPPFSRVIAMRLLEGEPRFITVEPILKGNMEDLANCIVSIAPDFINVGADSKGTDLEEPTAEEVRWFLRAMAAEDIEVREKKNLQRLLTQEAQ